MNLDISTLGKLKDFVLRRHFIAVALVAIAELFWATAPALAHHPFGGETPDNAGEAFLSGLGHPVIGIDHLTFVIAIGLLAAAMGKGLRVPTVFVATSMIGTGIHLMGIALPMPEWGISASVLVCGILLAMKTPPPNVVVTGLAAIAGIFHGFAYGEAILGAEMGPLVAYLLGFAAIQLAIAAAAYWVGKAAVDKLAEPSGLALRFAGFVVCGVGATFVSNLLVDSIFPA